MKCVRETHKLAESFSTGVRDRGSSHKTGLHTSCPGNSGKVPDGSWRTCLRFQGTLGRTKAVATGLTWAGGDASCCPKLRISRTSLRWRPLHLYFQVWKCSLEVNTGNYRHSFILKNRSSRWDGLESKRQLEKTKSFLTSYWKYTCL